MAFDRAGGVLLGLLLLVAQSALAQRPQDNWYVERTWDRSVDAANTGLGAPFGVSIGSDGKVFVADEGSYGRIQVYHPDGTFAFSITNGFGGGQSFVQPRGMIHDKTGNLYVADKGRDAVFVFAANGDFIRIIGGTNGTGAGQLSGVIDVAVGAQDNEVFVLENGNCRVSVFDTDGLFKRSWGNCGNLDGQLNNPLSIAASADGRIFICQHEWLWGVRHSVSMKVFDRNGSWIKTVSTLTAHGSGHRDDTFIMGGASVRLDPGGNLHLIVSQFDQSSTPDDGKASRDHSPFCMVLSPDLSQLLSYGPVGMGGLFVATDCRNPCHGIGGDGTMVLCSMLTTQLIVCVPAFREQFALPRKAIPFPSVSRVAQRPNSPLIDIDYQVNDVDDTNVHTAILAFRNEHECLSNCIPRLTLVEGSATNVGPNIAANQAHRVTWNAGADWSVSLGTFHVSVLARDGRPNLLDIHYLRLREGSGLPALKISRCPLVQSDFMQAWWWLLATNDVAVNLSSNRIYGVTGAYNNKVLCEDEVTTADGRAYLCEKMRLREATADEVQRARQATLPAGAVPNQWPPIRSVGGRPAAVNEYGFDTGNWDTNLCYWVVPLN